MMWRCEGNRTYHFSFILHRKKILASGCNRYKEGSKFCVNNGFQYGFRHSELDCTLSYRYALYKLRGKTLVNIRLSKDGRDLMLAKPCSQCNHFLSHLQLKEIWYSTSKGFKKL